jgi:hypothetical protein
MSASITKIFVDMDGVLTDFNKRYKEIYLISTSDKTNFEDNFRAFIDANHFATLDTLEGFSTLKNYLDSLSIEKCILSSTGRKEKHMDVSTQKMIWLADKGITWPKIFVPGKHLKKQYANPNSILIDDTESVINDWNEAGGIGILHKNAKTTIQTLKLYT